MLFSAAHVNGVSKLAAAGAKLVFVSNAGNTALTPSANEAGEPFAALVDGYNQELQKAMERVQAHLVANGMPTKVSW